MQKSNCCCKSAINSLNASTKLCRCYSATASLHCCCCRSLAAAAAVCQRFVPVLPVEHWPLDYQRNTCAHTHTHMQIQTCVYQRHQLPQPHRLGCRSLSAPCNQLQLHCVAQIKSNKNHSGKNTFNTTNLKLLIVISSATAAFQHKLQLWFWFLPFCSRF